MRNIITLIKNHLRKYFAVGSNNIEISPLYVHQTILQRRAHMYPPNMPDLTLDEKDMTFITAGKLDNNPFLMIDCVGTTYPNDIKNYVFIDKLSKLRTQENTYYGLAGSDAFIRAIDIYDEKCFKNNLSLDYKSDEFINEVIEIYKLLIQRKEYNGGNEVIKHFTRIYFISKNSLFYYSIDSVPNVGIKVICKKELEDNTIIEADYTCNSPKPFTSSSINNSLYDYCKSEVSKYATLEYQIDLKDKFSYIYFDSDNLDYKSPIKNNDELILHHVVSDYSELK